MWSVVDEIKLWWHIVLILFVTALYQVPFDSGGRGGTEKRQYLAGVDLYRDPKGYFWVFVVVLGFAVCVSGHILRGREHASHLLFSGRNT